MGKKPSNLKTVLAVALIVVVGSPIVYWAGRSSKPSGTLLQSLGAMPSGTCESLGKSNLEVGSDGRGIPDSLAVGRDIKAVCSHAIDSGQRDSATFFRLGRGNELLGDRPRALDAYQQSADAGNPAAMIRLASLLRAGSAASSDMQNARAWRSKALAIYKQHAEKGDAASLYVMGANSLFDEGGELEYISRVSMPPLEEAAQKGYAEEIYRLGAVLQKMQWNDNFRRNNADRIAAMLFEAASRNGSAVASLALAKIEMGRAEGFARYGRAPEMRAFLDKAKGWLVVARKQGGPGVQATADKLLAEMDNIHTQDSQAVSVFAALFFAALANGDRGQNAPSDARPSWGEFYDDMRARECNHAQASAAWGTGSQDFATATCLF